MEQVTTSEEDYERTALKSKAIVIHLARVDKHLTQPEKATRPRHPYEHFKTRCNENC